MDDSSEIIARTIREMEKHEVLWNTSHPEFSIKSKIKRDALKNSAKKVGLTEKRLQQMITYIKREYRRRISKPDKVRTRVWRWGEHLKFLENWEPRALKPSFSSSFTPVESTSLDTPSRSSSSGNSKSGDNPEVPESHVDSTDKIYFVVPNTENFFRSEDETLESPKPSKDTTDPAPICIDLECEESIASRPASPVPPAEKQDKKLLIDGICSALNFYLSNGRVSEEDLLSFHGDMMKYAHSYFKKKNKMK